MAASLVSEAFLYGSIAAAATALGSVAAVPVKRLGEHVYDALLGFGAGVMLAASMFSLLVPSIEASEKAGYSATAAALVAAVAVLLGALLVWALDQWLPHEHFIKGTEGGGRARGIAQRKVWLFVGAIAIHNVPEGLAIGVGAAGLPGTEAAALAAGIAIQDIPEGGVVTMSLMAVGYALKTSVWVAIVTGISEPLAAVAGAAFVANVPWLLPAALAFAAGAMIYVVSHEIIPESHRNDRGGQASAGLMAGFVLMMVLDVALG